MAGAEDDRDAVLAFLLGSTSDLGIAVVRDGGARVEDDVPPLEPVSDSDAEPETDATTAERDSDSDAATSCESEGDVGGDQLAVGSEEGASDDEALKTEGDGPLEPEDGEEEGLEVWYKRSYVAKKNVEPDEELQQEKGEKEKKLKKERGQNVAAEVKVVKPTTPPRGSARTRAAAAVTKAVASKDLSTKAKGTSEQHGTDGSSIPTSQELLFVGCVAAVLVAYLVACVYSFFHPLVVPLPDYKELYTAYDMSNVSVHIVNPLDNSEITPQGVIFEWELINFPADALQQYGAEVFRYRVSLNDEIIVSEVGFLAIEEGDQRDGINSVNAFNRTVRVPIPRRKFIPDDDTATGSERFKLRLQVTVPIPGLIEELKTYEQDVNVWKPEAPSPEKEVQLKLTSPLEGATFELGQSIVLEYTAINVLSMEVLMDDKIFFKKTHVNDGNLLLRGMGLGSHKFMVRALDEQGEVATSSVLHVEIADSLVPKLREG
ncbi:unnamed protein product [Phytophthora fragariaefolia]|uniref:Unnamed protein product n=1 Tax=Phytophthora fragariaefolia TaxID=1490495 RepID=A0A9W6Y668_9STRA|nr:unnamed protein product [Phytophthora fragariaefolia]